MFLNFNKVNRSDVQKYYSSNTVIEHYIEATQEVGLWKSESIIFSKSFADKSESLLELGCGTGRISFGLEKLGYQKITASDFSKKMILHARKLSRSLKSKINFHRQDATKLSYKDESFDGVIFGFNGLMQIPGKQNRENAIIEAFRVLRPGGNFIFTAHDRSLPKWKKFWANEQKRWREEKQDPSLLEFGDRFEETSRGKLYLHVPSVSELRIDLQKCGFSVVGDFLRSKIADEDIKTQKYSDECRFWICRKPS